MKKPPPSKTLPPFPESKFQPIPKLMKLFIYSLTALMLIATAEANASPAYKQGVVDGRAADIVYSNLFTGVHGNYLRASIVAAGLDPDNLPVSDPGKLNFGSGGLGDAKAWKDIWGSGQGIGAVTAVESVSQRAARLTAEYQSAKRELGGRIGATLA